MKMMVSSARNHHFQISNRIPKMINLNGFGCLFGSFLETLGTLFLIFKGPGDSLEMWWFLRGTLGEPRLRYHTPGVVTGWSVALPDTIRNQSLTLADLKTAKSWYQIGKQLIADWRIGNELKWIENLTVNLWFKELGTGRLQHTLRSLMAPKGAGGYI